MKTLFIITLFFFCTHLSAQTDSTKSDSMPGMHIRYYSISNDSMRLSVVNSDHVTIKQYKDHTTMIVYQLPADKPKNKIDKTLKKHK